MGAPACSLMIDNIISYIYVLNYKLNSNLVLLSKLLTNFSLNHDEKPVDIKNLDKINK